jgi:hypothetical protein
MTKLDELKAKWKKKYIWDRTEDKHIDEIIDEAFKLGQDDRQKEFDKTLLKVFKKKIKGATVEELDQAKLFIDSVEQTKSDTIAKVEVMIDEREKQLTKNLNDLKNDIKHIPAQRREIAIEKNKTKLLEVKKLKSELKKLEATTK